MLYDVIYKDSDPLFEWVTVLYIKNALNVTISTNLMMLWYMMNKCFVLMYWNYGAHVPYINDVNVELCMTI